MKFQPIRVSAVLAALALCSALSAQADVIVGDVSGVQSYGVSGGVAAYALGTTSCNVGTVPLNWIASTPAHPVIGQNIYRVKDGVFEQVGISWLKHGFTALQQNLCSPCNAHPNGSALGVGCSDPYGASLNGSQSGLGPRYQVNPTTGVFPYPFANHPITDATTSRRIQVLQSDVTPANNVGARYFGEGQYIAQDDAFAGNGHNNASWREMSFDASLNASMVGSTVREEPAIMAWPLVNPSAQVVNVDIAGERYYVGFNAISIGGGFRRYVYAVHNLNSDRAAGGFSVALPSGAIAQNLTFSGKTHHSGETWNDTTAWLGTVASNGVAWNTQNPFNVNPNGRALRWGFTFTFTFESNAVPLDASISFFKPSTPSTLLVPAFTVPMETWQVNSSNASLSINGATNNGFTGPIETTLNFGGVATLAWNSSVVGAPYDIAYQVGEAVSSTGGGIQFAPGYILNLNLADPNRPVAFINNGFQATMPPGGVSLPLTAPNVPFDLCAQLAIFDPASPVGVSFSAANELDVVACATVTLNHPLGDDANVQVTMGSGGQHDCLSGINYFGTVRTSFYVNSNGSVGFGGGNNDFSPTLAEFRSQGARIAGLWSDLNPGAGGSISSTSLPGQVTVNFTNVPAYGSSVSSSFSIVMNESTGVVSVDNYAPGAGHPITSIVGVSPGGNATANSVAYSGMGLGTTLTFPANQVIYQLISNGAPTGFQQLDFGTTGGNTTVTRVQ